MYVCMYVCVYVCMYVYLCVLCAVYAFDVCKDVCMYVYLCVLCAVYAFDVCKGVDAHDMQHFQNAIICGFRCVCFCVEVCVIFARVYSFAWQKHNLMRVALQTSNLTREILFFACTM